MRQIVLDTETTGLEWRRGNRIVEIGCIELVERRPTGRTFQRYINPQREFEAGAQEVTGLSLVFLADKPLFHEIADEFLAFIEGAELVIHNASFDMGFLDAELAQLDGIAPLTGRVPVLDTLLLARERFPGQRNTLDALCRRFDIDNSQRQLHGALLDAQLLVEVYLALTSGQSEIGFDAIDTAAPAPVATAAAIASDAAARTRVRVYAHEWEAHCARVQRLAGRSPNVSWEAVPLPSVLADEHHSDVVAPAALE